MKANFRLSTQFVVFVTAAQRKLHNNFVKTVSKKPRIEMNQQEETVQHKTRVTEKFIYSAKKNKPGEVKPTCRSWFCVWINKGPADPKGGVLTLATIIYFQHFS